MLLISLCQGAACTVSQPFLIVYGLVNMATIISRKLVAIVQSEQLTCGVYLMGNADSARGKMAHTPQFLPRSAQGVTRG